jgi:hypothetical protein
MHHFLVNFNFLSQYDMSVSQICRRAVAKLGKHTLILVLAVQKKLLVTYKSRE